MKVAIIGAGIFGCTTAIELYDQGHDVDIFDRSHDIMAGATRKNQQRLHRGYHYPRSLDTAKSCKEETRAFEEHYGEAIFRGGKHFYAIAKRATQTTPDQYLDFLQAMDLEYRETSTPLISQDEVDLVVEVEEKSISQPKLRALVMSMLKERGIMFYRGIDGCDPSFLYEYDHIIVACYSNNNDVLSSLGLDVTPLQYELVEKPTVRIPQAVLPAQTSIVIMDGPFCSLDPAGVQDSEYLLGHVKHAIMKTETADHASLTAFQDEMVRDTFTQRRYCWAEMQGAAQRFIPAMEHARFMGAYHVLRAVLPNTDATDERPTIVQQHSPQVTSIFSGKIPTAIDAAQTVAANLRKMDGFSGLSANHSEPLVC